MHEIGLKILVVKELDLSVAIGLERFLVAQAQDNYHVIETYIRTLNYQVILDILRGDKPLENFGPAPQSYWNEFYKGYALVKPREPIELDMPHGYIEKIILNIKDIRQYPSP